jgi:hypothetical protein
MEALNSSMDIRASITSFVALMLVSFTYGSAGAKPSAQKEPLAESQVLNKMRAILSEGRFWGNLAIEQRELKTTLFFATDNNDKSGFNVLVVVPEIQWTFEFRTCAQESPILIEGSGPSVQKVDAEGYLAAQMRRYSSFIQTARRTDGRVTVETEPAIIFKTDAAFKERRVGQIESALGELLRKKGVRIKIADFSNVTDQIDVIIPSLDDMYTMSVVHSSCDAESVEVGKHFPLKSIRPDLREKIQRNSHTVTLNH